MIPVLITIVCTLIIVRLFVYAEGHIDERKTKRLNKKAAEHFEYVAKNIEDCSYWLYSRQENIQQFKTFFDYIVKEMKTNHKLSGEGLRGMVDEIQLNNKSKKND